MQDTSNIIQPNWDIEALMIKASELERKIGKIERKGAKIRPVDLIGISFFAAINSSIIIMSILLLIKVGTKFI